jgi:hypothetical protein
VVVSFARHRTAALRSTITKIDNRRQLFNAAYYIGWALLLLAFVAIGARELWIGSHGNFIKRGPFASTDAYLGALLSVPNASERCIEAMSPFYGKRDLVYLCPRRSAEGDFVYDVLSYLSWPQRIRKIETDGGELIEELKTIDSKVSSAVIVFGFQEPPGFARISWFGPKLWYAPMDSSQ